MLEFYFVPRLIKLRGSLGGRLDLVHVLLKMGRKEGPIQMTMAVYAAENGNLKVQSSGSNYC